MPNPLSVARYKYPARFDPVVEAFTARCYQQRRFCVNKPARGANDEVNDDGVNGDVREIGVRGRARGTRRRPKREPLSILF